MSGRVRSWLGGQNSEVLATWCAVAAFGTYFCMYAFRKPFAVGLYEAGDAQLFGMTLSHKTLLVISQIAGYTAAKFLGIKLGSEMRPERRIRNILGLMLIAEIALVAFALVPQGLRPAPLFANGLALGMIWGIVFSFLEGRRFTEALGVLLCTSFIVSSGVVKQVGRELVVREVTTEWWMPAATGALFLPLLFFFTWMLAQIPPPSAADRAHRAPRPPMTAKDRRFLVKQLWPGLLLMVLVFVSLGAYREFRDSFAIEIWSDFGYAEAPAVLSQSETPIAIACLLMIGPFFLIKSNRRAFYLSLSTIAFGGCLLFGSTWMLQSKVMDPVTWMVVAGLGMYLPYIAFHVVIYERLLAVFRHPGNVAFLMFISDGCGYFSSVLLMLYRAGGDQEIAWSTFLVDLSCALAVFICGAYALMLLFFRWRLKGHPDGAT